MKYLFRFVTILLLIGFLFIPNICPQNLVDKEDGMAISKEQDTLPQNKEFRTWVSLNREPFEIRGYLFEISDSSILVLSDNHGVLDLPICDIDTLRARQKYSARRGAMIGAAMGALVGAIVGYSLGDDEPGLLSFTAGNKAFLGAAVGVFPGAIIGGGIGSIKIVIPIGGSINNFNKYKYKLEGRMDSSPSTESQSRKGVGLPKDTHYTMTKNN
jgi:hypothetical protein